MNYDELITITTDVGCLLLANGAEIYRVEESMSVLKGKGYPVTTVLTIEQALKQLMPLLDKGGRKNG